MSGGGDTTAQCCTYEIVQGKVRSISISLYLSYWFIPQRQPHRLFLISVFQAMAGLLPTNNNNRFSFSDFFFINLCSQIQRISVTSIPLKSHVICQCRNPSEDKLVLGCSDGSLVSRIFTTYILVKCPGVIFYTLQYESRRLVLKCSCTSLSYLFQVLYDEVRKATLMIRASVVRVRPLIITGNVKMIWLEYKHNILKMFYKSFHYFMFDGAHISHLGSIYLGRIFKSDTSSTVIVHVLSIHLTLVK